MRYRKNRFICLCAALLLSCTIVSHTPPASAQTPEPDSPVWPALDAVTSQLDAEAATGPRLDALAQTIAGEYAAEFGAEYAMANVFVLGNDLTFDEITSAYDTVFEESGWAFDESRAEAPAERQAATWSDGHHVYVIVHQPASDELVTPVLVTVRMLALEDFPGTKIVEPGTNPALAAIADSIAARVQQGTGAETGVRIMTFPAETPVEDVLAFHKKGMEQAGWQSDETLTQTSQQLSSMGWVNGDDMIVVFVIPASKQTGSQNLLLWIGATLPDVPEDSLQATATPQAR